MISIIFHSKMPVYSDLLIVVVSEYSPAIKRNSGLKNAIHLHFASRTDKMTGHIDNITLGSGMMLHLPKP